MGMVVVGGCQLGPSKKQIAAVERLRLEVTTRTEARQLLGTPWRSAEGRWHLDIYQLGALQLDQQGFNPRHLMRHSDVVDVTTLHLLFNPQDVLQKTNFHRWTGRGKVKGFLVNRVGPEFTTKDPDRIQIGITTRAQLEEWFGPPVVVGPDEQDQTTAIWFSTTHGYGGYVDGFEHRNLTVTFSPDGTVGVATFRGNLKAVK